MGLGNPHPTWQISVREFSAEFSAPTQINQWAITKKICGPPPPEKVIVGVGVMGTGHPCSLFHVVAAHMCCSVAVITSLECVPSIPRIFHQYIPLTAKPIDNLLGHFREGAPFQFQAH